MPGRRSALLLAACAGVLHTASFAPLEWWWLQILALAGLAALMRDASPRRAAALGWAFGTAWLGSGLWWLFNSLYLYGHLPAWMSVLAVAVLAALLALYYAAAGWLWSRWRTGHPLADAFTWAAAWSLGEIARGTLLTGFPWIAGGYAHTGGPLAGWAAWIGVYGIGLLAAWLAAGLAFAARAGGAAQRLKAVAPPLLLALAGWVLPQDFTRASGDLSVTLLQTNVAQDVKFEEAFIERALRWHADRLATARGTLVVSPESSLPLIASQVPASFWEAYAAPFRGGNRGVLLGVFTGDDEHGYTNSVVGLSAATGVPGEGRPYVYGKRHLLPFGEFIPPGLHWFVAMLNIPLGDQARGTSHAPFVVGGQRVRPLICYEDLFGENMVDSMAGADAATVLVNVSNLAWFGTPMIQDQDLQFSRMRSLEFQRPLVRSTNTGSTAAVDHLGRVTARMAPEVEGALDVTVQGRVGETPYARWLSVLWLWPWWLIGVSPGVAALVRRRLVRSPA